MAPQFVKPYVKTNKNDVADAEAICENDLPGVFRQLLQRLGNALKKLDRQVGELDVQIQIWHRDNEASEKLAQIPGIGPITATGRPSKKVFNTPLVYLSIRGECGNTELALLRFSLKTSTR
jgi:transposase